MVQELTEPQERLCKLLSSFVRDHRDWYSHLEVALCLQRGPGGLSPLQGRIYVVPRVEKGAPEAVHDYGDFILTRYWLSIESFEDLLMKLAGQHVLSVPKFGDVVVEGNLQAYGTPGLAVYRKHGGQWWANVSSHWPFFTTQFQINVQSVPYSSSALAKVGLPLYPNWYFASHYFLGYGEGVNNISNSFWIPIAVPDPRMAIKSLKIIGSGVEVELEEGELSIGDVLVKVFASKDQKAVDDVEIEPHDTVVTKDLLFEPEAVSIYVLSKVDGDAIDYRDISSNWAVLPTGVTVSSPDEEVLALLRGGESTNVEFKLPLDESGVKEKIPKVVASFANTEGGVVFIGVNDEGVPTKSVGKNEKDRISQVLELVEPRPLVQFRDLELKGIKVLAVFVAEGQQKPYVVRERGIFVRHSATTAQASHLDLLAMSEKARSPL